MCLCKHKHSIHCVDIHLSPGCSETALYASRLSCALSEERASPGREVAERGRASPRSCYQLHLLPGGSGTSAGAPPPASGSSDAPDPRRPAARRTEREREDEMENYKVKAEQDEGIERERER